MRPLPALQRLLLSGSSHDGDFFLAALKYMLKALPMTKSVSASLQKACL